MALRLTSKCNLLDGDNLVSSAEEIGKISDGYHSFDELYEYRKLYNAAFFNELAKTEKIRVIKSHRHNTGEECFGGGWFIVMAQLPTGQISNHYENKEWDLFKVPEVELADKWDGHTPQEAAKRLEAYLRKEDTTKYIDVFKSIPVKIKLEEGGIMPQMKSAQAAAFDVYCPDEVPISLGRQVIDLKFKMEIPPYLKANIRPRSGHSVRGFEVVQIRNGIREKKFLNSDVILGLVDSDYRNNVGVILKVDYTQTEDIRDCYIEKGARIGQMEFAFVPNVSLVRTESLDMSADRGGGFGHTNNK